MKEDQARYARLAKISQLIHSKLDLHSILAAVATAISEEIVRSASSVIYLSQPDGTFRGFVGKPDQTNGLTLNQNVDPRNDLLARDILATRKSIYIPDTGKDPRPHPIRLRLFGNKSLLGLPMAYGDELYGLMFLFDDGTPMDLSKEQIQTVEAYVSMAAVAVHHAKQFEAIQSLLWEKQLLLDVTRELSWCSGTEMILETCFRFVERVLNNMNIGVHLYDASGGSIHPAKLNHKSEWPEGHWRSVHNSIKLDYEQDPLFQEVVRTKKYVFIPDVDKDTRPNHDVCRRFGVKGLLLMPLVAAGDVLGMVSVSSLRRVPSYTEVDMQLAQSVVDATATALSNAIQLEQLESIIGERTEELRENHRILELILNSAEEGIYGLDLEGRITFCNPAAARMLGRTVEELIGVFHRDILFEPEKPAGDEADASLFDEFGRTAQCVRESRFRRSDGSVFPIEYALAPIVEKETVRGGVVTFSDISERKRTEEIIRKTDKLSVIGELAAGVAHEIRNPLTTLRGFVQLLYSNPQARQEYLEIMLSELDRINFIVSELLFIAKPPYITPRPNDLLAILQQVAMLLRTQAILNKVEILLDWTGPIPPVICAESQLKQAFIHIVKNAIESMESGGLLQIQVSLAGEFVVIRFKDQGGGVSKERIPKLGEPFFTTKEKGVGLGLMAAFQIIKHHHGRIHIESAEGQGTTVQIELPLVPSDSLPEHLPYTYKTE